MSFENVKFIYGKNGMSSPKIWSIKEARESYSKALPVLYPTLLEICSKKVVPWFSEKRFDGCESHYYIYIRYNSLLDFVRRKNGDTSRILGEVDINSGFQPLFIYDNGVRILSKLIQITITMNEGVKTLGIDFYKGLVNERKILREL